jgi:hypothetical protein
MVLSGDQGFDDARDQTLLVYIDERLELHGRGEQCKRRKYFWVCRRIEVGCYRVNAHSLVGRRGIDQVR